MILPFLLIACGGSEPTEDAAGCEPGSDPTLLIGAGSDAFDDVGEGGTVELVHGPQGGYHIELALRATGLDDSDLATIEMTGSIGGVQLASTNTWQQLRCNPEADALEVVNIRLIYDAQPEELDGQDTDVTATATDGAGTTVEATTVFHIEDPLL